MIMIMFQLCDLLHENITKALLIKVFVGTIDILAPRIIDYENCKDR